MKFIIVFLSAYFSCCNSFPQAQSTCGVPAIKPDTSSNIIGGKDAIPYSWPWQVALTGMPSEDYSQYCGGTLISSEWIVTSARCGLLIKIMPPFMAKRLKVRLGVYDKNLEEPGCKILGLSEVHVHPKFVSEEKKGYDIAVVKLDKKVEFTDHISPICLPAQDEALPPVDTVGFVTGWGSVQDYPRPNLTTTLKQLAVPVVSTEQCNDKYPSEIYKNMFCAGYTDGTRGFCDTDMGGPLVYQEPTGVWKQIGIASFSSQLCEQSYGVYTTVSGYIDFIKKYVTDL